jgi:hypothetical protein
MVGDTGFAGLALVRGLLRQQQATFRTPIMPSSVLPGSVRLVRWDTAGLSPLPMILDIRQPHQVVCPHTRYSNVSHVADSSSTQGSNVTELHARAQRFTIQAPIRYREVGGTSWFEGITENISRSGVLFRADHVLEPKAAIQMSFSLPVKMSGERPAKISWRGTVVRTVLTTESNLTVIAARIERYRFGHVGHRLKRRSETS